MWSCQLWLCAFLPRSKDRPLASGVFPSACHPGVHLVPAAGGSGPLLHAAAPAAGAAGSAAHLQPGHGGFVQLHVLRGEEGDWLRAEHLARVSVPELPDSRVGAVSAEGSGSWLGTVPVLPQEEQCCPAVLDFLPFLTAPAIDTGFHSS